MGRRLGLATTHLPKFTPSGAWKIVIPAIGTGENRQCVNPYELPADRPTPASWDQASAQHAAAVELALAMPDAESVAYAIVSERLDVSSAGRVFNIRADLSPILSHYGPGIYTLTIWATTPDGEDTYIAKYPIWWHTDPTPGHPY